jgi:hypothetical protein
LRGADFDTELEDFILDSGGNAGASGLRAAFLFGFGLGDNAWLGRGAVKLGRDFYPRRPHGLVLNDIDIAPAFTATVSICAAAINVLAMAIIVIIGPIRRPASGIRTFVRAPL